MRPPKLILSFLAIVLLAGCSKPVILPDTPPAPQVPSPILPQNPSQPPQVVEPGRGPGEPSPWNGEKDVKLQAFFQMYYDARKAGDRNRVEQATGGAYQQRALSTLNADLNVAIKVDSLAFPHGGPDAVPFTPTVIRTRDQKQVGIAFRLEPVGDSWRIMDMLDPATARWLSDPPLAKTPIPAVLETSLGQFLHEFYRTRSFDITKSGVQLEALRKMTASPYDQYLTNLLRRPTESETYTVTGFQVLGWWTEGESQMAEVKVTRQVRRQVPNQPARTETGESQLRIQLAKGPDDAVKTWRVADGFLVHEVAWVSTMGWSGALVAA